MIISSGLIIIAGFILLAMKLKLRTRLLLLGHSGKVDLAVSIIAYALHWGTFTGVMAAAAAGLMCSIFTGVAIRMFGSIRSGIYTRGWFDLTKRLET